MSGKNDWRPHGEQGMRYRLARGLRSILARVGSDLRDGRHREAYVLFIVGFTLAVLGLADALDTRILLSACLAALAFLVFNTTLSRPSVGGSLEDVLQTRESFESLPMLLRDVRDLRVYGPTAVNVTVNVADIRRHVLERNGTAKILVQDASLPSISDTAAQLDDNLDLISTLKASIDVLKRLAEAPGFEYRFMPFNPGFSLFIVNPDQRHGYLIFECHGFNDNNIADRMHIRIEKRQSPYWFNYWLLRFNAMWEASRQPCDRINEIQADQC